MMASNEENQDKAGQNYWNQTWEGYPLPSVWDVDSKNLSKYVEHEFFNFIAKTLEKLGKTSPNVKLIEVGCARYASTSCFSQALGSVGCRYRLLTKWLRANSGHV